MHDIVARAAKDGIVAKIAVDIIIAALIGDQVIASTAKDRVPVQTAIDGVIPIPGIDQVRAFVAQQAVRTLLTIDRVVVGAAKDGVISLSRDNLVIAIATDDHIGFIWHNDDPRIAVDRKAIDRPANAAVVFKGKGGEGLIDRQGGGRCLKHGGIVRRAGDAPVGIDHIGAGRVIKGDQSEHQRIVEVDQHPVDRKAERFADVRPVQNDLRAKHLRIKAMCMDFFAIDIADKEAIGDRPGRNEIKRPVTRRAGDGKVRIAHRAGDGLRA